MILGIRKMGKIYLDSAAFRNNLTLLRNKIDPEIALVLKDNAYGHGLLEIAQLAAANQVKSVFVKNWGEAQKILAFFPKITVLYPEFGSLPDLIPDNILLTVNHLSQLEHLPPGTQIELKVNTNTNRNGLLIEEVPAIFTRVQQKKILIKGVFTHNGYGSCGSSSFTQGVEMFKTVKKLTGQLCQKNNLPLPRFHSLCSSGALRIPHHDDSLVRVGLAIYGYLENLLKYDDPWIKALTPVASVWANRIACKKLNQGALIGYDGFTKLNKSGYVSTYDLGYGDGFPFLTTESFTLPCGLKIFPKISMDCFSTWGKKEQLCVWNNAQYVAKVFHCSVYEILVRLNPFIPRKII